MFFLATSCDWQTTGWVGYSWGLNERWRTGTKFQPPPITNCGICSFECQIEVNTGTTDQPRPTNNPWHLFFSMPDWANDWDHRPTPTHHQLWDLFFWIPDWTGCTNLFSLAFKTLNRLCKHTSSNIDSAVAWKTGIVGSIPCSYVQTTWGFFNRVLFVCLYHAYDPSGFSLPSFLLTLPTVVWMLTQM